MNEDASTGIVFSAKIKNPIFICRLIEPDLSVFLKSWPLIRVPKNEPSQLYSSVRFHHHLRLVTSSKHRKRIGLLRGIQSPKAACILPRKIHIYT